MATPTHPIAAVPQPVPLSVVLRYPILMHEVGSGTRAVTERAFASKKLPLRPSMTLASTEAIKNTAATGVGIAILSTFAVKSELAAGTLVVVPMKGLKIDRPLYRMRRKGAWASPALEGFLAMEA